MNVLVTGATGFLGKYLLPKLRDRGHDITVLTRNIDSAKFFLPVACNILKWEPLHENLDPKIFKNIDAVIHLAGAGIADKRWSLNRKYEIERSRIFSTRNLINALKKLETKPKIFLGASAIGFYKESSEKSLEEDEPKGQGFLSNLCAEWEKEIFSAKNLGIRTAAFRIGFLIGRGGVAMGHLLPIFKLGLGGPLGRGHQIVSWAHVEDCAKMFVHGLENDSLNGIYNAVAPQPVSNKTLVKTLAGKLNRPTWIPTPAFCVKLVLGEMSQLLLESKNISSKKIQISGFLFDYPDINSAIEEICSTPNHHIQTEQWVPLKTNYTFKFFSNAYNLEKTMPSFLKFKINRQSTLRTKDGSRLSFSFNFLEIPFRWKSKIIEWKPPYHFVNIQLKGPFDYWQHTHSFEESNGGALIRQNIEFRFPFGPIGELLGNILIKDKLKNIIILHLKNAQEFFSHKKS